MLSLNPVFRFAAGRAWNHDLPILASICAFAALLRAAQPKASARWMGASGALLGLALGTRLTFLPLIVPFLILTLIFGFKTGAGYRGAFFF